MANRRNNLALEKSKRLQTLKKKAKELSILCNVDVCLVGTKENNSASGSSSTSSSSSTVWHTWPEDPDELARVVNKYKNRVGKVDPPDLDDHSLPGFNKRAFLELDVDKALEGVEPEDLHWVLDRANELAGDVDEKLDLLARKNNFARDSTMIEERNVHDQSESAPCTERPMELGFPSNRTVEEEEGSNYELMVVENIQPVKRVHELDSNVANRGPKIFGVYLTPAPENAADTRQTEART